MHTHHKPPHYPQTKKWGRGAGGRNPKPSKQWQNRTNCPCTLVSLYFIFYLYLRCYLPLFSEISKYFLFQSRSQDTTESGPIWLKTHVLSSQKHQVIHRKRKTLFSRKLSWFSDVITWKYKIPKTYKFTVPQFGNFVVPSWNRFAVFDDVLLQTLLNSLVQKYRCKILIKFYSPDRSHQSRQKNFEGQVSSLTRPKTGTPGRNSHLKTCEVIDRHIS